MYQNKRILAVIPARGGSKGIPKKNLASLGGRPLLCYSIDSAKKSRFIDRLVVSSDSEEILAVAAEYGAESIRRPGALATDRAKMDGALRHAILKLQKSGFAPDLVVVLQPTSPFRTAETIDRAISAFADSQRRFDALTAVSCLTPKIGHIRSGRYIPAGKVGMQRQELPAWYKECGTVFVFKTQNILAQKPLFGARILPFVVSDGREILDIDTPHDLDLAECLCAKLPKTV